MKEANLPYEEVTKIITLARTRYKTADSEVGAEQEGQGEIPTPTSEKEVEVRVLEKEEENIPIEASTIDKFQCGV